MSRPLQGIIVAGVLLAASFPVEFLVAPDLRKWVLAAIAGISVYVLQRVSARNQRK